MSFQYLSPQDHEHFLERGFVLVPQCFSREAAQTLIDKAWVRLGYDSNDSSTWTQKRIHMPSIEGWDVREFAPKAWNVMCELLGGEERIQTPWWSDAFIANLGIGADEPWQPPSPQTKGWHKDGDFFRHFLDSPEQGLLTIVLWSDIEPRGGGTFLACDSVPVIARFLAQHPEGILPNGFNFSALVKECHDFHEATGKVGDVILIHPYLLHTVSQNHNGKARFITNPPVSLKEPMNFNRSNPSEYSPVEMAVLRGLGVEKLDFAPTASREKVVPERVKKQDAVILQEKERLQKAERLQNAGLTPEIPR